MSIKVINAEAPGVEAAAQRAARAAGFPVGSIMGANCVQASLRVADVALLLSDDEESADTRRVLNAYEALELADEDIPTLVQLISPGVTDPDAIAAIYAAIRPALIPVLRRAASAPEQCLVFITGDRDAPMEPVAETFLADLFADLKAETDTPNAV